MSQPGANARQPYQQGARPQPLGPQAIQTPPKGPKRFGFLAVGVAAFAGLVLGSCSGALAASGSDASATSAAPAATVTAPAPTVTVTAQAEPAAQEPTEEATEEPTEDPTTEAPAEESTTIPKKRTYTGSGDDVIKFKKAITDPVLVSTSWSGGDDNNTIYAYDSGGTEGDLLVNTIGSFEGTALTVVSEGDEVKALKIEGSGSWKITPQADHRGPCLGRQGHPQGQERRRRECRRRIRSVGRDAL